MLTIEFYYLKVLYLCLYMKADKEIKTYRTDTYNFSLFLTLNSNTLFIELKDYIDFNIYSKSYTE